MRLRTQVAIVRWFRDDCALGRVYLWARVGLSLAGRQPRVLLSEVEVSSILPLHASHATTHWLSCLPHAQFDRSARVVAAY